VPLERKIGATDLGTAAAEPVGPEPGAKLLAVPLPQPARL